MNELFMDPETYVKVNDMVSVMWRSTVRTGFTGTVLDIGPGEYGYRTFIIQKEGTEFGTDEAIGVPESQAVLSVLRGDCLVSVPLPITLEEATDKENRRLVTERKRIEKKAPLFAAHIEIAAPNPQKVRASFNREGGYRLARDHAEAMQCNQLRSQVESLCTPEDFTYLLGRRSSYPKDALYGKQFWSRQLAHFNEHGTIERMVIRVNIRERLNLPWLKYDSRLIWKTAPGGPQPVRILFVGTEDVMVQLTGEPMKDFNPRDFPESRNVWIKPEDFAELHDTAAA